MKLNQQTGNYIIIISITIFLAIASLFVEWGSIKISANNIQKNMTINGQRAGQNDMQFFGSMFIGQAIPITGKSGSINLGLVKFPCWLSIVGVIFAIVVTATNMIKISAVSPKIIYTLLYIGLLVNIWLMFILLCYGSIGIGGFLSLGAIIICFKQQKLQKTNIAQI